MEKADIEKIIYEVLEQKLALNITTITPTELLAPLADTDDWSFLFIPELEERLGVSVDNDDWSTAGTIEQVRDMLYRYARG